MAFDGMKILIVSGVLCSIATSGTATVVSAFPNTNFAVFGDTELTSRVVRTVDSQHTNWPTPNSIPYRIDPRYSPADVATIQGAITEFSTDMSQCIRFVPYNNATDFNVKAHLYIGPLSTPAVNPDQGTLFTTCFSFPGLLNTVANSRGAQKLGIVNGTEGCMNQREVMKYLANALGLRDEWKRPDRESFIRVNLANVKTNLGVQPLEITRQYNTASVAPATVPAGQIVDTIGTNFDYNSITMPLTTKYTNGGRLYDILNPGTLTPFGVLVPAAAGNMARLSRDDCRGLAAIYASTCAAVLCGDPYNPTATPLPPLFVTGGFFTGIPGGTFPPGVTGAPIEPTAINL